MVEGLLDGQKCPLVVVTSEKPAANERVALAVLVLRAPKVCLSHGYARALRATYERGSMR